jgi:ABC-type lipoprotein release transport system permease subunit
MHRHGLETRPVPEFFFPSTEPTIVRIALGASRADLLRLVMSEGMRLPALGVGLGLLGAFAVMRVIDHLLFQVTATDPATFVSVAMLLMAVSFLACWIPARRAAHIDPIAALRCE